MLYLIKLKYQDKIISTISNHGNTSAHLYHCFRCGKKRYYKKGNIFALQAIGGGFHGGLYF